MERFFQQSSTLARFRRNPFGQYIDAYADWLYDSGYSRGAGRRRIQLAERFCNWVIRKNIAVSDVGPLHIKQYLYPLRHTKDARSALDDFLDLLRRSGMVVGDTTLPATPNPSEQLLIQYERYLKEERVLAEKSAYHYTKFVRWFIAARFGDGDADLTALSAKDVIDFVRQQAAHLKKAQAKSMTTALRSFLRFAALQGSIASGLEAAVPIVPKWSVQSIPKSLSASDVERVLTSCDRETIMGRRNYAILLLLSRLGLRAGAIVSLELDDINWRAASITIRSKGTEQQLPLPSDVGAAIAAYLKEGRPQSESRSLFLCIKAPLRPLTNSSSISQVVHAALARAGIVVSTNGAHQFRHTLATDMLRAGATLVEIGQVLGHVNPDTTAIYAKVDLLALRQLALPWPEVMQ